MMEGGVATITAAEIKDAMETFQTDENVDVLVSAEDGAVERIGGKVVSMADYSYLVRVADVGILTFMYSAPDDMWLRVVPNGGAIANQKAGLL